MPALGETARQKRETESGQNPGLGEAVHSRCTPSNPLRIDLRAPRCVVRGDSTLSSPLACAVSRPGNERPAATDARMWQAVSPRVHSIAWLGALIGAKPSAHGRCANGPIPFLPFRGGEGILTREKSLE